MKQPLLIADSGGTKTDWCFVDEQGEKHFFTSESYHPCNWSTAFIQRTSEYWNKRSELKKIPLHFFSAGCLHPQKSKELESIFDTIGFEEVTVKSDLHAAGLALFGNKQGTFAIMGTGSVLVDWNEGEVTEVYGGKGHIDGDEGSGFYFGRLVCEAYLNGTLSQEQEDILKKEVSLTLLGEKHKQSDTKYVLADVSTALKNEQFLFLDFHRENIHAFYHSVLEARVPIDLQIMGGYFYHNSTVLLPILSDLNVHVVDFQDKPIHLLVDYMIAPIE